MMNNSLSFVDADGDNIELIYNEKLGQVQEHINGKLAVHRVRYFYVDSTEGKFRDVGGFGKFANPEKSIPEISAFFESLPVEVDFQVTSQNSDTTL